MFEPIPMPNRRRCLGRVASPTHATKGYKRTDIQTHRQQNEQRGSCWRGSRIARVAARISRTACSLRSHCLCWLRSQSQQRASRGRRGWMCSGDAALSARGGRGRCLEAKRTRTGPHMTQHVVAGALGCLPWPGHERRKVGRAARARRAGGCRLVRWVDRSHISFRGRIRSVELQDRKTQCARGCAWHEHDTSMTC